MSRQLFSAVLRPIILIWVLFIYLYIEFKSECNHNNTTTNTTTDQQSINNKIITKITTNKTFFI